ncbi:M48 family metallopeptidase [Leptospira ognonensis]|nr:SprT family zinc-dependent metalloprotease [Leptospira ognonensis]
MKSKIDYPGLGYPCELIQNKGKNVSLSVYPNNRIVIRYPKSVSFKFILEFLEERKSWVKERYNKNKTHNPKRTEFNDGEILPIFGVHRKISYSVSEKTKLTENLFILNIKGLRSEQGRTKRALKFLKEELENRSIPVIEKKIAEIGTKRYSFTIKSMRSLWGSCSPRNKITLNLALIFCPEFVLRYVILHEVSHTKEHNHSKKFWSLLESLDPDYEIAEKWIKTNGQKILCYLF